jgi:hypothetical protein
VLLLLLLLLLLVLLLVLLILLMLVLGQRWLQDGGLLTDVVPGLGLGFG